MVCFGHPPFVVCVLCCRPYRRRKQQVNFLLGSKSGQEKSSQHFLPSAAMRMKWGGKRGETRTLPRLACQALFYNPALKPFLLYCLVSGDFGWAVTDGDLALKAPEGAGSLWYAPPELNPPTDEAMCKPGEGEVWDEVSSIPTAFCAQYDGTSAHTACLHPHLSGLFAGNRKILWLGSPAMSRLWLSNRDHELVANPSFRRAQ